MGLGHNDPWVESHIRPQKMWGQRSSRGQWPLFQFFAKNCHCIHILDVCSGETRGSRTTCLKKGYCIHILWCIFVGLDTMILGRVTHITSTDWLGVKGHLGVNDLWFKFLEKKVSVPTYFDVFSNLMLQWLQKYVIAKAGETRGSRTTFGSSFGVGSNLILQWLQKYAIAKAGKTHSSRTALYFIRSFGIGNDCMLILYLLILTYFWRNMNISSNL